MKGQGLKLAGEGANVGKILDRLVSMGNLVDNRAFHGALGQAVIHGVRKSMKGAKKTMGDRISKHAIQHLKSMGDYAKHEVSGLVNKHKNKPIHISDIFDKHADKAGKLIHSLIHPSHDQGGSGYAGGSLRSALRKSIQKLKQFANGNTKLKPSHLATGLATAITAAGTASAFIPGLDLFTTPAAVGAASALGAASKVLKMSGRGLSLPGGGGKCGNGKMVKTSNIIGSGPEEQEMDLDFSSMPKFDLSQSRKKRAKSSESNAHKRIRAQRAASGPLKRTVLPKDRAKKKKIAAFHEKLGAMDRAPKAKRRCFKPDPRLAGKKLEYGVTLGKSGRPVRNKYSVWHGYHSKTSGGLTKADLMIKPKSRKIVISKKMHARGQKLAAAAGTKKAKKNE